VCDTFFFFFSLVTGPNRSLSLKLSDTRVYEPHICVCESVCGCEQADETNADAFAVRGRALFFSGEVDQASPLPRKRGTRKTVKARY
jgi:hypothetical protein